MSSSRPRAADRVGASASFGSIRGRSERGQIIAQVTGEAEAPEQPPHPPVTALLGELAHNPFNPREELVDLDETAESLRVRGQLQPIAVVRRAAFLRVHPEHGDLLGSASYVVIDGNRRLAAAELASLQSLRIDVNDDLAASAHDMLESALIANIHRVDVPPIDQAKGIQELLGTHRTQSAVAKRLGKTEAWVSQRMSLLSLEEDLQEKVETGQLTVRDGRRIGRLPAGQQHAEAERALNRVKPPRKPRGQAVPTANTTATGTTTDEAPSAAPAAAAGKAVGSLNPVKSEGDESAPEVTGSDPAAPVLNPVKAAADSAAVSGSGRPGLPWADPAWFNEMLREHMSAEHREQLVLLLMADRQS